jgi:hypothetical protein
LETLSVERTLKATYVHYPILGITVSETPKMITAPLSEIKTEIVTKQESVK